MQVLHKIKPQLCASLLRITSYNAAHQKRNKQTHQKKEEKIINLQTYDISSVTSTISFYPIGI